MDTTSEREAWRGVFQDPRGDLRHGLPRKVLAMATGPWGHSVGS